jgi:hypothetical protein
VPADIVIFLNHNDGCALIACHDSGTESGSTRPSNDDIGHTVPLGPALGGSFDLLFSAQPGQASCAKTKRSAFLDEISPGDIPIFIFLCHVFASPQLYAFILLSLPPLLRFFSRNVKRKSGPVFDF